MLVNKWMANGWLQGLLGHNLGRCVAQAQRDELRAGRGGRSRRRRRRSQLFPAVDALETRTLLTFELQMVGYFETWNGGVIPSTDAAGIAYYSPAGTLVISDSEINELPEVFDGNNIFETTLDGSQLIRSVVSNNDEPTGIAYSEFDGFFYLVNDQTRRLYRYDANLNSPLASVSTTAVGAPDPEGVSTNPFTGDIYVVDGASGNRQVVVFDANMVFQYSFSFANETVDAEGIAYNPANNHLYIVSDPSNAIFEYMLDGTFITSYDISQFSPTPRSPQGLTFGPTSDPNDDPNAMALYIADGGVDNFPDGRIYEAVFINTDENQPPTVFAGSDQELFIDDFDTDLTPLNGIVADDGLVNPLITTWTQISGPIPVVFGDPNVVATTVSFPEPGEYVLQLTADDGEFVVSDQVTLTVHESAGATQMIDVQVSASSDDAEEFATGRVILPGADLELVFDRDNQTVGLRFNQLAIPQGATIVNAYVQFQVDETSSEETLLTIQGQAADNPLTFTTATGNVSSRPRTEASVLWSPPAWTTVGARGPDQQTPNIAAIIQEIVNRDGWASGNSLVILITGTGRRVAEAFDGTFAPLLHVEYIVDGGNNNAPPTDVSLAPNSIAENTDTTTAVTVGALSAVDADADDTHSFALVAGAGDTDNAAFQIVGDQLQVRAGTALNFEDQSGYSIRVEATDLAGASFEKVLTVNLLDLNEDPTDLFLSNTTVSDGTDTSGGATVGTLTAEDEDVGETFDYAIVGGADAAVFSIGGAGSDELIIDDGVLDAQTKSSYEVTVRVTDSGGLSYEETFLINVADPNDPPTDLSLSSNTVAENAANGTVVGTLSATDPDADETFTYSLVDDADGRFAVNETTGEITVANGSLLDAEQAGSHEITARVTDTGGLTYDESFIINVTNVNEAPVADDQSVSTLAGVSLEITLTATDPESALLEYTVIDGPSNGTLSGTAPNLTYTPNPGFVGEDSFDFQAGDGVNGSNVATVSISVLGNSTTVEVRVAASSDDAEERTSGSIKLNSSDLELTLDATDQTIGMRFNGVEIPEGAVITNAYLQFQSDENQSAPTSLLIQGQAADNPATFTTTRFDISSRPKTAAAVAWEPPAWTTGAAGPAQQTPDISAVIQEIVDRDGWVSGNSLVLLITGTGLRVAESFDGSQSGAPLLHVEYSLPAGDALLAAGGPAASLDNQQSISTDSLDAIADEAIARWEAAGFDTTGLQNIQFRVEDLPGSLLSIVSQGVIVVDVDAAGFGWFVDATPGDNAEFRRASGLTTLLATPNSVAYGRIDLLSVVLHEVGHLLNIDHDSGWSVMESTLQTGTRHLLRSAQVDNADVDSLFADLSQFTTVLDT